MLNGFLQSVLSLGRFARQAHRMSGRHPEWAPSPTARASESGPARGPPTTGSRPTTWGAGPASTNSAASVASPKYRAYHQDLLGDLARIPYLPAAWRERFEFYRVRWGGAPRA